MGQNVFRDQTPFLQTGNPNTENRAQDGYSKGQLGYRFTFADRSDPGSGAGDTNGISKRYQLVLQDSTDDVIPTDGMVAYWRDATGYRVTGDLAVSGRGLVAGVYRCQIDPDNVGCIQQGGPSLTDVSGTGTPDATGLFAIPSSTAGQFDTLAAAGPLTYPPIGVTIGTTDGNNQALVELQLPGRE